MKLAKIFSAVSATAVVVGIGLAFELPVPVLVAGGVATASHFLMSAFAASNMHQSQKPAVAKEPSVQAKSPKNDLG